MKHENICHDNFIGFNNSPEVIQILLNDGTCMNIRCSLAPPRSLQEEELLNENFVFQCGMCRNKF
jgi:hypothetical protein